MPLPQFGESTRLATPSATLGCDAVPSDLEVMAVHAKLDLFPLLDAIGAPGGALNGDRGAHLPEKLASIQASNACGRKKANARRRRVHLRVFSKGMSDLPALDHDTSVAVLPELRAIGEAHGAPKLQAPHRGPPHRPGPERS